MLAGRDAVPAGVDDAATSPGGSWGSGSGALRTPVGPGPVKGQSPGYRGGASKDADASGFDASDPALPGRPAQSGPFRRNPEHAPFGAPSPSGGGRKRKRDDGRIPAPQPTTGAAMLCALSATRMNRCERR